MLLFPRVMTLRSCHHLHPTNMTVLIRASAHLTMAISQEGKRRTLVASGGHIPWVYEGMRCTMFLTHQILLPLSWVEVFPLVTQGPRRLLTTVAKLR